MAEQPKDHLAEDDLFGRLSLSAGLVILGQLIKEMEGAHILVLRWVFIIAAIANLIILLMAVLRKKSRKT